MLAQALSISFGLVTGLVTGFYFERRASSATRKQNAELRSELQVLKTTMFSMGASDRHAVPSAEGADLARDLAAYAAGLQDADGRIDRHSLYAHFSALGYNSAELSSAIGDLFESEPRHEHEGDTWVRMR